jgi:hypothetical protein
MVILQTEGLHSSGRLVSIFHTTETTTMGLIQNRKMTIYVVIWTCICKHKHLHILKMLIFWDNAVYMYRTFIFRTVSCMEKTQYYQDYRGRTGDAMHIACYGGNGIVQWDLGR